MVVVVRLVALERVAFAELALKLFLQESVGRGGKKSKEKTKGERKRYANSISFAFAPWGGFGLYTYVINAVDKRIVAAVAHRKPIAHEPNDVDKAISVQRRESR